MRQRRLPHPVDWRCTHKHVYTLVWSIWDADDAFGVRVFVSPV